MTGPVTEAAATVLAHVDSRAPTLGEGRLVCVDGPAGSGKTTLAEAIVAREPTAVVLHTDEMLAGWRGLPGLAATVAKLLRPLAEGRAGSWRRWDWHASSWAESHVVAPGGLLVLEGVGSWAASYAPLVGCLAWVEVDRDLRLERGIARDGEQMRPFWEQWMVDEAELHAGERTRARADVVVDGRDGSVLAAS